MEKVLLFLETEMATPQPWGWFHWIWIFITIGTIACLVTTKHSEKKLKILLLTYGIIAAVLELTKQLIWTFDYNALLDIFTKDYQWYAAPFQLCTTPMYVSIMCGFMKPGKERQTLLSYMAFVTILGGLATILMPSSCFTSMIQVNVHTMWLHCGGLIVSVYLLASGVVKAEKDNLLRALCLFTFMVAAALIMNVVIYNSGVLDGDTFNMFYISPYFISSLPVFDMIQQNVPYAVFLAIYIIALSLGACLVYGVTRIAYKMPSLLAKSKFLHNN